MEVGHNEEAEGDSNNAEKFDAIVRASTMSEIVGDFLVKNNASTAGGEDNETNDEGAKIK